MKTTKGKLYVISGPSGVGKGTIVKELVNDKSVNCQLSISVTSREKRDYEENGREYHFKNKLEIEKLIQEEAFLEYATYAGNYYGTLEKNVDDVLEQGINVILEIEVQGAIQVKARRGDANLIFIMPPSFSDLEKRLLNRGTESMEVIQKRIDIAKDEINYASSYDQIFVNDDLAECVNEIKEYMNEEI
jgi:guanylate kinase